MATVIRRFSHSVTPVCVLGDKQWIDKTFRFSDGQIGNSETVVTDDFTFNKGFSPHDESPFTPRHEPLAENIGGYQLGKSVFGRVHDGEVLGEVFIRLSFTKSISHLKFNLYDLGLGNGYTEFVKINVKDADGLSIQLTDSHFSIKGNGGVYDGENRFKGTHDNLTTQDEIAFYFADAISELTLTYSCDNRIWGSFSQAVRVSDLSYSVAVLGQPKTAFLHFVYDNNHRVVESYYSDDKGVVLDNAALTSGLCQGE